MNELVENLKVSQGMIFQMQDVLLAGETVEPITEHFFAEGVYGRLMKVPAGNWVVGAAHKTDHISILLKGKASITMDDGSVKYLEAPMMTVVPAGKKKMAYVLEEMWFVNIHPTDTEDLDIIESRVIIPESEHRLACNAPVAALEGVI